MRPRNLAAFAAAVMGFGALAAGLAVDAMLDLPIMGATLIVCALGWLALGNLSRPTAAAYELGHDDGYREGYEAGRHFGRPVVVSLDARRQNAVARGTGTASCASPRVRSGGDPAGAVDSPAWTAAGPDSPN